MHTLVLKSVLKAIIPRPGQTVTASYRCHTLYWQKWKEPDEHLGLVYSGGSERLELL